MECTDLPRLIKILSVPHHLPHSLRLRNLFLAPILERDIESLDTESCFKAWISHHGERSSIRIYGELPPKGQEGDPQALFGILVMSNGLRMVDDTPVIDLYVSHEPLLKETSLEGHVSSPSQESVALFTRMYQEGIVPTLQKWNKSKALYFGINRCWTRLSGKEIIYEGNCTRVMRRLEVNDLDDKVQAPPGYLVRKATAEDCKTILSFSSHPRPLTYYQSRTSFSAVVVDQKTDEPVAWALTHDDLSIGSLHTVEAHRKKGLAQLVVAELSRQFATRFSRHPLHSGPVYIHADCEAYNVTAVRMFTRIGFDEQVFVAWVGVETADRSTVTDTKSI